MVKGIIISLHAMTASFRDPNTHLYQETIPIPPPTTIVGITGAALGLPFEEAMEYFKTNKIAVGCSAKSNGFGRDLWGYSKIKNKDVGKDILVREFLSDLDVEIFISCRDKDVIDEIYGGFKDPKFALSLGNSDELVWIKGIEICKDVSASASKNIKNSWIHGNYIDKFELDWDKVKKLPIKSTIKPPIVKNLPIDFEFTKNGERIANKFGKFTFLGDVHILREAISIYLFNDKSIPLYEFN